MNKRLQDKNLKTYIVNYSVYDDCDGAIEIEHDEIEVQAYTKDHAKVICETEKSGRYADHYLIAIVHDIAEK